MKSCKKSGEKFQRFGKGNSGRFFSGGMVLRLFNILIIPSIRKTSFLSHGASSVCSYSHLPFFLSRGEDARASASCPSSASSKQAVRVVEGRWGFRSRG